MTAEATSPRPRSRTIRVETAILISVIAMVLLLAGLTAWVVIAQRRVFRYSSDIYLPAAAVLCPAEVLSYSTTLYIDRLPATPYTVHSWWSVDGGYTANDGRGLAFSVWTDATPPQITQAITVTVPALAAGHYEYRVATTAGSTVGAYAVPLTVPASCP